MEDQGFDGTAVTELHLLPEFLVEIWYEETVDYHAT